MAPLMTTKSIATLMISLITLCEGSNTTTAQLLSQGLKALGGDALRSLSSVTYHTTR